MGHNPAVPDYLLHNAIATRDTSKALKMTAPIPRYLVDMVGREAPVAEVVPGSTPVVAFGDPFVATVATMGISPTLREFLGRGQLLDAASRRR